MRNLLIFILFFLISNLSAAQQSNSEALAAHYFQNGEYDKAVVIYEDLYKKSRNSNYYDPYFTCLLRLKKYDAAEQLTRKLQKLNPQNYTYPVDLGRISLEKGEKENAEYLFNSLIKNLPKNEFAIRDLATNFYRAEAYDLSIKTFLAGRKLLNDEKSFGFDLISLYRYRKDKLMLMNEYITMLESTPEILTQAQNSLANLLEEPSDYEILKTSLLRRIQKDPQNVSYTEFLVWVYIQQKEFSMAVKQSLALDRRLKEDGERVFELSRILTGNMAYEQAIEALEYLAQKGEESRYYLPSKIDLLNLKTKMLTTGKFSQEELLNLEKDYEYLLDKFGRNSGTSFAIRQLASLQAYYLKKPQAAITELENLLDLPALNSLVIAKAKLELGDIFILSGEVWDAALIYGQVEKQFANEPSGQEAKFKNARLSYFQGDFLWAKAQLDVLKASTSQLFANDALNLRLLITDNLQNEADTNALKMYAQADLLIFKNQSDPALLILDSIESKFPGNSLTDDILMSKAKIHITKNEFKPAVAELQKIYDNFSFDLWADDAIFMLADLNENKLNQPEKAKILYQKIISDYPGSLFVIEARKRFRNLRGDSAGS
ncbi:tetratricopeptide repeat protein [Daejeonella oryzae]|uniref:tetratricopeptide repeat protein n=1 Tax=Daejeonella oryzae TaxID=1122943 RepID=UPI00047EFCD8|nr:tetratricopeptide repeat protein [Daejeonella oryzae]